MKKNFKKRKMLFTGERMIPELNKGKTFYYEHLLRYLFASQFIQNKKVLDAGCGAGYGTRMLYELGGREITGSDISKEAIEYAMASYRKPGVQFIEANAEKLPDFKEKFEVVVAFEILEHLSDQRSFLKGVKANLKSGGILLVSTPNKFTYPSGNQFHLKELSPGEFKKLLKEYFNYVYLLNQQFLFSNSLQLIDKKNNLDLGFMNEKYIKDSMMSINPSIDVKESRYLVAVCSDQKINNISPYLLNTFTVDEFSLRDGVEGMTSTVRNNIKELNKKEEIKELKRAAEGNVALVAEIKRLKEDLEKIQSAKFYKIWQSYCRTRDAVLQHFFLR